MADSDGNCETKSKGILYKKEGTKCWKCEKGVRNGLQCISCTVWAHFKCAGVNGKDYRRKKESEWGCGCRELNKSEVKESGH